MVFDWYADSCLSELKKKKKLDDKKEKISRMRARF